MKIKQRSKKNMDKLNQSVLTGCIYAIHNIVTNKYYIG